MPSFALAGTEDPPQKKNLTAFCFWVNNLTWFSKFFITQQVWRIECVSCMREALTRTQWRGKTMRFWIISCMDMFLG
jgi:hypothetical protein